MPPLRRLAAGEHGGFQALPGNGRGDGFEVYSTLVGRLSPFGRRTDGRLVVRNPLENLDGLVAPRHNRRFDC